MLHVNPRENPRPVSVLCACGLKMFYLWPPLICLGDNADPRAAWRASSPAARLPHGLIYVQIKGSAQAFTCQSYSN